MKYQPRVLLDPAMPPELVAPTAPAPTTTRSSMKKPSSRRSRWQQLVLLVEASTPHPAALPDPLAKG